MSFESNREQNALAWLGQRKHSCDTWCQTTLHQLTVANPQFSATCFVAHGLDPRVVYQSMPLFIIHKGPPGIQQHRITNLIRFLMETCVFCKVCRTFPMLLGYDGRAAQHSDWQGYHKAGDPNKLKCPHRVEFRSCHRSHPNTRELFAPLSSISSPSENSAANRCLSACVHIQTSGSCLRSCRQYLRLLRTQLQTDFFRLAYQGLQHIGDFARRRTLQHQIISIAFIRQTLLLSQVNARIYKAGLP